jgi:hypothetical protein
VDARVQVESFVLCGMALLAATPARVVVIASVRGWRARNTKAARREGHLGAGVEGGWRFGNVGSLLFSAIEAASGIRLNEASADFILCTAPPRSPPLLPPPAR